MIELLTDNKTIYDVWPTCISKIKCLFHSGIVGFSADNIMYSTTQSYRYINYPLIMLVKSTILERS